MSVYRGYRQRIEAIFCRIDPSLYSQKEISRMAYGLLRTGVSDIYGDDLLRTGVSDIYGGDPAVKNSTSGEPVSSCSSGKTAADLKIARTEYGKPYFEERRDIHFSISHAGEYILIAVGEDPLGVDIEKRRKINCERLGRKIMTDEEYRIFLESEDREEEFYRRWVLMESYVKWTGLGFAGGIQGLPMNGWSSFLYIDRGYFAAVRTEFPAEIILSEYRLEGNIFRKL